MSAPRTAVVGVLATVVGLWIAVATTGHVTPAMSGYDSLQTVARVEPATLVVVGVLTVIGQWVVGGPKSFDGDGGEA